MKFLDLNGVATLWNKIKSSFVPYNPSGISLSMEQNESLRFKTNPQSGIVSYVGIGEYYPLWISDTKDEHSASFAVQIDDEKATIVLSSYSKTSIAPYTGYLASDHFAIVDSNYYTVNIHENKIDLYGNDSDITIDGESIIPQAIENSWLNSNLT